MNATEPIHLGHSRVDGGFSLPAKVAILAVWAIVLVPGNFFLGLCVYFERVHNRKLYRGLKDRLTSLFSVVYLVQNVVFNPLYAYRVVLDEPLADELCMVMSASTFLSTVFNGMLTIDFLLTFAVSSYPWQK